MSRTTQTPPWWAYGALALSMTLVGSYVALSKPLVAAIPVALLAWMRFGLAALAMAHWWRKPAGEPALDGRTQRLLFLESFLGNFLFSLCMLWGVSLTSAVAAGVILSSIPAVVAVLSAWFLGERLERRTYLAIALAALGIALYSLGKPSVGAANAWAWLGNVLVFGAVLCEAAYVVIGKRLAAHLSPKRISAIINLWGLVLMTPLGLWWARSYDFSQITLSLGLLLVFYALAASMWTVWLWMTGLRWVPAAKAGVFTVMLPTSAACVGVAWLGESLSPVQWLAFAMALCGLVLATLPSRTTP